MAESVECTLTGISSNKTTPTTNFILGTEYNSYIGLEVLGIIFLKFRG